MLISSEGNSKIPYFQNLQLLTTCTWNKNLWNTDLALQVKLSQANVFLSWNQNCRSIWLHWLRFSITSQDKIYLLHTVTFVTNFLCNWQYNYIDNNCIEAMNHSEQLHEDRSDIQFRLESPPLTILLSIYHICNVVHNLLVSSFSLSKYITNAEATQPIICNYIKYKIQ